MLKAAIETLGQLGDWQIDAIHAALIEPRAAARR